MRRGGSQQEAWNGAETLLLLAALPLLGWAMVANPARLNPDAVAYLTIARHWAEGNAALAVNGYWGPLFSWLVVPLRPLAGDWMAAGRLVMAGSALLYLLGGMLLLRALGLPAAARLAGGLCLLATALGWSVAIMTPDLLVSGLLLLGMALALDERWRASAAWQLGAGAVFGLAYYAKAVALPLGTGLMLACVAWQTMTAGRAALPGALRSAAALLLVAAPWIVVLSLHYGTPTFSTSGAINFTIAGPESIRAAGGGLDPHHPAFTRFHSPREGRVTAWEEPSETAYPRWSPLADAASVRHLLWLFRSNVEGALGTLRGYDVVPLGLAALLLAPLLAFGGARPWHLGLVPVAMVVAMKALVALLFPLAFGLIAVLLGKDDNWDLLHYHFYNPHAWLHGRHGHDVLAADFHVFFNPLLDLPFYLGNQYLPGVALTFILGAVHGVNGVLLWRIARHTLRPGAGVPALVPAAIGMLGAGSLFVVGTTYYDALVAIPVFAALWLILRDAEAVFDGKLRRALPVLLLAGVLAGAAVGLKQTVAIFAVGIGAALLLTPGRRLVAPTAYGIGLGIGVLAVSGYWLWHLWQTTGNPLFPYFNDIFRSPLAPIGGNRTRHAMPANWLEALGWPFVFTRAPWRFDAVTRDPKLLVAYVLVPLGLVAALAGRDNWLAEKRRGLFLLLASAAGYLAWLLLFSIYRYVIPLEMLAPLLILVAIGFLPLAARWRRVAAVALMLVILPIQPSNRDRIPWAGAMGEPFVWARPPAGMDLAGALVVVPGWHPGWRANAFTIPFFPPEVSFVRIIAHDDPGNRLVTGFDDEIARRIATHQGPLYVLYTPPGEVQVAASLARHTLTADFGACGRLATSIGGPLALCPVTRR